MNKARSENSEESSFEANWGSKLSLSVFQKLGTGMIGRKSQTTFVHLYLMLRKYIHHVICHDGRRHVLAHWKKKTFVFCGREQIWNIFQRIKGQNISHPGPRICNHIQETSCESFICYVNPPVPLFMELPWPPVYGTRCAHTWECAQLLGSQSWFAITISRLPPIGITKSDRNWLFK